MVRCARIESRIDFEANAGIDVKIGSKVRIEDNTEIEEEEITINIV